MEVPKLVEDAVALAERLGFPHSSIPEIGRLLHVLVAARPDGRVAEIGTGCGVGAAWIASALGKRGRLVTVELDSGRAGAAAKSLSR